MSANQGINESGKLDFVSFLAAGDMMNHAIMTSNEIKNGFNKLYLRGLLNIDGENIKLTTLSESIFNKISKMRGGLFSTVDNCLKTLNSPRSKLPELDEGPILEFITEEFVNDIYKKYLKWSKTV